MHICHALMRGRVWRWVWPGLRCVAIFSSTVCSRPQRVRERLRVGSVSVRPHSHASELDEGYTELYAKNRTWRADKTAYVKRVVAATRAQEGHKVVSNILTPFPP